MTQYDRRSFVGTAAAAVAGCICGRTPAHAQLVLTGNGRALPDFPILTQPDDISCGPTSAAMVLRWYGIDAGIERCKTKAGTRWFEAGGFKVGMTLPGGMVDCLNYYRLPSRVVKASIENLMRFIDQNRPPMLLVRSGVKTWHWVVAMAYYDDGARIKLSDPAGKQWIINRGTLESAWGFSTDLEGNKTGGRRCHFCAGSGKLASARVPCTNCAGTGKMISNFQVKKCRKCGGSGSINVSGGQCLRCHGSGVGPDDFRHLVETFKVTGNTAVVPDRGRPAGKPGGTTPAEDKIVKIKYTIRNESNRVVRFHMKPSGKSYSLDVGRTFEGTSNEINGKAPTITLSDSNRTYNLTPGKHKFWWIAREGRIGFSPTKE